MNKSQLKTRLDFIDYAKALGILLIVFEHVSQYFSAFTSVNKYIDFRVSIFFVVSGGLFYYTKSMNLSFDVYLNKKFKSLIIPYIVFSIINSALKLIVLYITNKISTEIVYSELQAFFITGNGTVWFLLTLFLIELAFFFIYKIKNNVLKYAISILCALIPFVIGQAYNGVLIVILRVLLGLGYYIFGYYFFKAICQHKDIPVHIGFICILFSIILSGFSGTESYFGGYYTKMLVTIPCNLSSICGYIILFLNIKTKINILRYIGRNSLIIMLVHPIILLVFTFPLSGIFSELSLNHQIVVGLLIYVIVMILEVPCIFIINRFLPFMIGKSYKKLKETTSLNQCD